MSMADQPGSAAALLELVTAYQLSQAIAVAAELGVADLLADGPKDGDELARLIGCDGPSLARLLRATASVGVFEQDGDGRFRLTASAEHLRRDVPGSLRDYVRLQCGDWYWRVYRGLRHSVQTGQPAVDHIFGMGAYEYLGQHPEEAALFNSAMASFAATVYRAAIDAYDFSRFATIIDIGGGHGALLTAILNAAPHTRGILFDQPNVVPAAERHLDSAGLRDRCAVVGGDFLTAVPDNGDAYVLSRVIHDWNDIDAGVILTNCSRAMQPEGTLIVLEQVVPPGNAASLSKRMDLTQLLGTSGRERTEVEYRSLYETTGFDLTRIVPTASPISIIEGLRRPSTAPRS
jgi:ubiquinone/menaquinone biosynthesis C-methylase UbiE